jgi:hypothetical protein
MLQVVATFARFCEDLLKDKTIQPMGRRDPAFEAGNLAINAMQNYLAGMSIQEERFGFASSQ